MLGLRACQLLTGVNEWWNLTFWYRERSNPGITEPGNDRTREWPNPGTTESGNDRAREHRTREVRARCMPSSTASIGRPSAFLCISLLRVHSLILPHHACCISACCSPRHSTRRRSFSMLVLSSSNTHYHNRYIGWCGCHEILIALCFAQEVFCRDQKMSESKNLSHPDDKRITQRSDSNTNWRDKTSAIVISERVWRLYPCMLVHWICLFSSVSLCGLTLTQVLVDSSFKIEEFFHEMAISLENCWVEQKNHSFHARWHGLPFSGDRLLRSLDNLYYHLCVMVCVHTQIISKDLLHCTLPSVSILSLSLLALLSPSVVCFLLFIRPSRLLRTVVPFVFSGLFKCRPCVYECALVT